MKVQVELHRRGRKVRESPGRATRRTTVKAAVRRPPPTAIAGDRWCATLMSLRKSRASGSKIGVGLQRRAGTRVRSRTRTSEFNASGLRGGRSSTLTWPRSPALIVKLAPSGASVVRQATERCSMSGRWTFRSKTCSSDEQGMHSNGTASGLSWSVGDTVELRLLGRDNAAPTWGGPAISGTPRVVETLTASTGRHFADVNGHRETRTFSLPVGPGGWREAETDISRTRPRARIALVEGDRGKRVKVRISYTDDDGYGNEVTSGAFPTSGTITEAAVVPATCAGAEVWSATLTVGTDSRGQPRGTTLTWGLTRRPTWGRSRTPPSPRTARRTRSSGWFSTKMIRTTSSSGSSTERGDGRSTRAYELCLGSSA